MRLLMGVMFSLAVLAGALVFLLAGDGKEEREVDPAPTSTPLRAEPASEAAIPDVFEPDEDGKLSIPAAALASGKPITLELRLLPEEIGDQPMTASLRSNRETHALGEAVLDRATGRARLSIDPERLPPGEHLLAIRVADDSWNPHRRVAITVTED